MPLNYYVESVVVSSTICVTLTLFRIGYRLLSRCKIHSRCHRSWASDDALMTFAFIPLAGRSICITLSFTLNPSQSFLSTAEAEILMRQTGKTLDEIEYNQILSQK